MRKEKSLCESCSNRIVIKFHGKHIRKGKLKGECFYDFKVPVSDNRYGKNTNGAEEYDAHVSYVIVEECSFYNKYNLTSRFKSKHEEINVNDDSNDTESSNNERSGVTFVNIPGALLP
jgi:hypothetical protein